MEGGDEHFAGWGCRLEYKGYSGCWIEAEEMMVKRRAKCLRTRDCITDCEPGANLDPMFVQER